MARETFISYKYSDAVDVRALVLISLMIVMMQFGTI